MNLLALASFPAKRGSRQRKRNSQVDRRPERERERERERETETETETERQRQRQTDRDRQTERQAGRQAGRQTGRQTDRQTNKQTDSQTGRQTWLGGPGRSEYKRADVSLKQLPPTPPVRCDVQARQPDTHLNMKPATAIVWKLSLAVLILPKS